MARLAAGLVVVLGALYAFWPGLESLTGAPLSVTPGQPGRRVLPASYQAPGDIDAPVQISASDSAPFAHQGFWMRPRAVYHIQARVLAKARYRFDHNADLAPFDLLLGWGPMADDAVLSHFSFRQNGRFGFWNWDHSLPIPQAQVSRSIANVHLIPASEQVERALGRVREGQNLRLSGLLVDVRGPDGSVWNTSLKRTDQGDGACEILFATRVSED